MADEVMMAHPLRKLLHLCPFHIYLTPFCDCAAKKKSKEQTEEELIDYIAKCYNETDRRREDVAERVADLRILIRKAVMERRPPIPGSPRRSLRAAGIAVLAIVRFKQAAKVRKAAVITLARVLKSINPSEKTKKLLATKLKTVLRPKEMELVQGEVTFEMRRTAQQDKAEGTMSPHGCHSYSS